MFIKKLKIPYLLISILRILMGGMLLFSGIVKLQTSRDFYDLIYKIGIISFDFSMLIGNFIIFLEIIIGSTLLLGIYRRSSLRIAFALITSFSLYLLGVIVFELEVKGCGCFGRLSENSNPYIDLARDFLILLILTVLYKSDLRRDLVSFDGYINKLNNLKIK